MDSTRYIVCDDAIQYVDDQGTVLAEVTFPACAEGVVDINHTFVGPSLRGQGIAGELMRRTVEALQERNLHAHTSCSYAATWFDRHPEHAGLRA